MISATMGGYLYSMLKDIFECLGYNFKPEDLNDTSTTAKAYHRIIETFRYAYARRALLGDKNFANVTEVSWVELQKSCGYAHSNREEGLQYGKSLKVSYQHFSN